MLLYDALQPRARRRCRAELLAQELSVTIGVKKYTGAGACWVLRTHEPMYGTGGIDGHT
jgi:hypothetical protein